jgi:transposase
MSRDPWRGVEHLPMTTSEAAPKKRRRGRAEPYRWRVSDGLWARLESLLQDPPRRFRYPGRSRYPARQCLEGILYVLFTDTPWLEMPYRELGLPSGETCRRRLEEWEQRGLLEPGPACAPARAARCGSARLVARDRRCLHRGRQKGGAQVARTLLGRPGSRYHLAVDARGAPLEVRLSAGNENVRRHLLPLVDGLIARGIVPQELWADRGYHSRALAEGLLKRAIEPHISAPRRAGDPVPWGQASREVWRGRQRRLKTRDPQARHRWPVERTNAWLKAMRRIGTRRERKPENYLAFLRLGMIVILARSF